MVRDIGFEPMITDSESVVLPLDESRENKNWILYIQFLF